ncbi:MAG: hypothetical protein P9M03_05015 [Candidatus Theseobacter exili]|nr:hypothetical protein [Candidatus Theseobacter exili]
MKVTKTEIIPIPPSGGMIAIANVVIDDVVFLGSIGVHQRLDGKGIRLTFPTKKAGKGQISIFHPLDAKLHGQIQSSIEHQLKKVLPI